MSLKVKSPKSKTVKDLFLKFGRVIVKKKRISFLNAETQDIDIEKFKVEEVKITQQKNSKCNVKFVEFFC